MDWAAAKAAAAGATDRPGRPAPHLSSFLITALVTLAATSCTPQATANSKASATLAPVWRLCMLPPMPDAAGNRCKGARTRSTFNSVLVTTTLVWFAIVRSQHAAAISRQEGSLRQYSRCRHSRRHTLKTGGLQGDTYRWRCCSAHPQRSAVPNAAAASPSVMTAPAVAADRGLSSDAASAARCKASAWTSAVPAVRNDRALPFQHKSVYG